MGVVGGDGAGLDADPDGRGYQEVGAAVGIAQHNPGMRGCPDQDEFAQRVVILGLRARGFIASGLHQDRAQPVAAGYGGLLIGGRDEGAAQHRDAQGVIRQPAPAVVRHVDMLQRLEQGVGERGLLALPPALKPDRHQAGVKGDTDRALTVGRGGDQPGDTGAMGLGRVWVDGIALAPEQREQPRDLLSGQVLVVEIDRCVIDADDDPRTRVFTPDGFQPVQRGQMALMGIKRIGGRERGDGRGVRHGGAPVTEDGAVILPDPVRQVMHRSR